MGAKIEFRLLAAGDEADPKAALEALWEHLRLGIDDLAEPSLSKDERAGLADYLSASGEKRAAWLSGDGPWTVAAQLAKPTKTTAVFAQLAAHWIEAFLVEDQELLPELLEPHGVKLAHDLDRAGVIERAGKQPLIHLREKTWRVTTKALEGNGDPLPLADLKERERTLAAGAQERGVCCCVLCLRVLNVPAALEITAALAQG